MTITPDSVAIVIATLLGPILAVQVQKVLEKDRAARDRQIAIFRILMTQRLALSPENVRAFNAVPIEFYQQTEILAAWRAYVAHMSVPGNPPPTESWTAKRVDLLLDLLQKMAVHLRYDFNFVQLKDDFYWPKGHSDVDADQEAIRRGLAEVFRGNATLPLDVKNFPGDPETQALLKKWLKDQTKSIP
jgi:hypothetical protein